MSNSEISNSTHSSTAAQSNQNNNTNLSGIKEDIDLMVTFAVARGIAIPVTYKSVDSSDTAGMINNYNTMLTAIAPATVESIKYINSKILYPDEKHKLFHVPVFTKCLIISFMALVSLIAVSLMPEVNSDMEERGLLLSSGKDLFVNIIFICSASLLGVMFFLLKTISAKIRNYTLLPVDSIELNATILIGVISGFMIAELFSFTTPDIVRPIEMHKMTLALLGGFSSDAIFTIFRGIVNKFKLLFNPG